jgi:hypothetical protein
MTRRFVTVLVLLLVLAGAAWGLEDDLSDFTFKNMVDQWTDTQLILYPDLNLIRNPSMALDIGQVMVFPNLSVAISNSETEETIPAGEPQAGGYLKQTNSSWMLWPVGGEAYIPLSGGMIAGGELLGGFASNGSKDVDSDFNTAGETITTTETDRRSFFAARGLFAMEVDSIGIGGRATFTLSSDPAKEEFDQVSGDPATAETYTTNDGVFTLFYDDTTTTYGGTVGMRMASNGLDFGLGARLNAVTEDSSTGWKAVDKNGDGFAESIVSDETYYTTTETWGFPFDTYSSYDYKNQEQTMEVTLYPHLFYELGDGLRLLGSGYWMPIATETVTSYERTDTANENQQTTTFDSGLASFGALGGVEWSPMDRVSLRSGLGYEHERTVFSQNELDAGGTTTFDPDNTSRYAEVSFGADLQDGQVINNADNIITGTSTPTTETIHRVSLNTGAMWNPVSGIRVYSNAELNIQFENEVYKVFNTADNTVWTEEANSSDLDWGIDAVVGFAFQATDDLTLGMEVNDITSLGDADTATDSLPTGPAGTTTTPGDNLDDSNSGSFSLSIYAVLGL